MRAPDPPFPSFALAVSSAYTAWDWGMYPTHLPSYPCGCSARYHPYPKRLPARLPVRVRRAEPEEKVFAFTVEDWDSPPTDPPAAPRTPDLDLLNHPPFPPLFAADIDPDTDTVVRLEAAMNPQSDAPSRPPVLRRRLSTLIIDLAHSVARKLKTRPSRTRIRPSSSSVSLD